MSHVSTFLTLADLSDCHCNDSIFNHATLDRTNINGAAFGDVRLNHASIKDISLCCVKDRNLGNTSMDYATIDNCDLVEQFGKVLPLELHLKI